MLEDCHDDVALIEWEFRRAGIAYTSVVVTDEPGFRHALATFGPDVVLADHSLPRFSSVEAFRIFKNHIRAGRHSIPFILVTGGVSVEFAAEFLRAGIDDFISKDSLNTLPAAVQGAISRHGILNDGSGILDLRTSIMPLLNSERSPLP